MSEQIAAPIETNIKKEWANVLVKLRRQLRGLLRQYKELLAKRRGLRETFAAESKKTFKNQYRIAELEVAIAGLDIACGDIKNKLVAFGGFLFEVLPMYEDSGASDHDFAQLINYNAKKMEQHRADFNEMDTQGHSFFADAIFILHAEQPIEREKEPFVIFSDLPFFDAMTCHFMREMEVNSKFRQAIHDKTDELLPELQANQYIAREAPNGEVTFEKYYPPLKLVQSGGKTNFPI